MAAMEDGEIAQQHVVAVLQANGFVAHARLFGPGSAAGAPAEALAPDAARAGDGDVLEALAPQQAVAKMAVPVILILAPLVGLGQVVGARSAGALGRGIGRDDGGAHVEIEGHIAHQVNGIAEVAAGGEENGSAAGRGRGLDGLVDGGGVERRSASGGPESPDVEKPRPRRRFGGFGAALSRL